jgi:glycosyltransferase involved in cell wall biosynthesis
MKVRFISAMPRKGYSGGRLLALTMAEALATQGVEVDFLVNEIPEMYDEFRPFSSVTLRHVDFANLSPWADREIDVTVIVPVQGSVDLHGEWARHAIECRSKTVLLNFESPNWFNAVSPYPRPVELWQGWEIVSENADMVLSISAEGDRWARDYYQTVPADCVFDYCHPGINSLAADLAPSVAHRSNEIVMLTRIDPHKGFDSISPVAHSSFRGYRLLAFVGTGDPGRSWVRRWTARLGRHGVDFKVAGAITGVEKFALLKRAAVLYFPTRFEGFGIPPLEAAYCLLPCACSDLPVLREFGGEAFTYGDPTSETSMRDAVLKAIESGPSVRAEHDRIRRIADIREYGSRLVRQLEGLMKRRRGS